MFMRLRKWRFLLFVSFIVLGGLSLWIRVDATMPLSATGPSISVGLFPNTLRLTVYFSKVEAEVRCARWSSYQRGNMFRWWDWQWFADRELTAIRAPILPFVVAALVLLATPFPMRRKQQDPGRCVRCGYLIGGAKICPECGFAEALE